MKGQRGAHTCSTHHRPVLQCHDLHGLLPPVDLIARVAAQELPRLVLPCRLRAVRSLENIRILVSYSSVRLLLRGGAASRRGTGHEPVLSVRVCRAWPHDAGWPHGSGACVGEVSSRFGPALARSRHSALRPPSWPGAHPGARPGSPGPGAPGPGARATQVIVVAARGAVVRTHCGGMDAGDHAGSLFAGGVRVVQGRTVLPPRVRPVPFQPVQRKLGDLRLATQLARTPTWDLLARAWRWPP